MLWSLVLIAERFNYPSDCIVKEGIVYTNVEVHHPSPKGWVWLSRRLARLAVEHTSLFLEQRNLKLTIDQC